MQPKPGAARIDDAAWCYPEPAAGRENLKDHVTFTGAVQVQRGR